MAPEKDQWWIEYDKARDQIRGLQAKRAGLVDQLAQMDEALRQLEVECADLRARISGEGGQQVQAKVAPAKSSTHSKSSGPLTPTEQAVVDYVNSRGGGVTYGDVAKDLGFKNENAAGVHLRRAHLKRALVRESNGVYGPLVKGVDVP
jgi:ClpP class serine protease